MGYNGFSCSIKPPDCHAGIGQGLWSIYGADSKALFQKIAGGKGEYDDYSGALKFLSRCLYQATGKKAVLLIDEYDVPLENAYFKGFYGEMVDFIRSLFE